MFPQGLFFFAMTQNSNSHDRSINTSRQSVFDVLVIGGGIVGSGVARDAAMRGLRTMLVEQQDFAAGTSSRSSRLLHGGIRYLAQGHVGLVREANREKTVVQQIAPHLTEPLAFIFPTRRKTQWSRWKLGIGVKIYDLLCGRRNLGGSQILSRGKTIELLPELEQQDLTGSVRYFDGFTHDARLTIDTLRSASAAGAEVRNYVRLIDARRIDEHWHCDLEFTETGEKLTVVSRSVVNATGPWSSRIPNSNTNLRLTKGVHLVIERSRLSIPDAVVLAQGERILFAIPWGQRVVLGTTDTDYDGPLESPECEPQDVAYVLDAVNEAFPNAGLSDADVLSTWAGIRPLVADPNGNPSDISRRHKVEMADAGWWDITGGKLTTYRLMAEEAVNEICEFLGAETTLCRTADIPILDDVGEDLGGGVLPPEMTREAVVHFCKHEWAIHLDDIMIRRTSWRYYEKDHRSRAIQVAEWMREALDWSEQRMTNEIASYSNATSPNALPRPEHLTGMRSSTQPIESNPVPELN